MRKRLIELLLKSEPLHERDLDDDLVEGEVAEIADYLLANGVIVPPVKLDPSIEVSRIVFKNRIEVVKNVRYEWNEARFCFSEEEADRAEAMFKYSRKGADREISIDKPSTQVVRDVCIAQKEK